MLVGFIRGEVLPQESRERRDHLAQVSRMAILHECFVRLFSILSLKPSQSLSLSQNATRTRNLKTGPPPAEPFFEKATV